MTIDYTTITDYLQTAGKSLLEKAGKVKDIGITKEFLTEEDLAIELELKKIIAEIDPAGVLYAEEAHDVYVASESVWAVDPISGTEAFIKGLPHFAGALILQEAGGKATNLNGDPELNPDDRVFVGANNETYPEIRQVLGGLSSEILVW